MTPHRTDNDEMVKPVGNKIEEMIFSMSMSFETSKCGRGIGYQMERDGVWEWV
jgi:hypothetical protein